MGEKRWYEMQHGTHEIMGMGSMNQMMQDCIEACSRCHDTCVRMVDHCLTKGGKHAEAAHIKAFIDCSDLCHASEDFMLRSSALHARVCGLCAEACAACAASCEAINDDEMMQSCIDACRRCEASCRSMAQMA